MWGLIGKTLNEYDNTFTSWVVGVSSSKAPLLLRQEKLIKFLADKEVFFTIKNSHITKTNIPYSTRVAIRNQLKTSHLDTKCPFISTFGLTYDIIKLDEIK